MNDGIKEPPATIEPEESAVPVPETAEDREEQESSGNGQTKEEASEEKNGDAEKIENLERELAETRERLLRIAADFENFRKRTKREHEEALVRGREEVLKELLVVFDNLERAMEAAGTHATDQVASAIVEGVAMVQKQFSDGLARFGLRQFESLGQPFDPNFHEAMAQKKSDEYPPGVVIVEYQKGYMLGERLLRAAMVVVSSADSTGKAPGTQEETLPDTKIPEERVAEGADTSKDSAVEESSEADSDEVKTSEEGSD